MTTDSMLATERLRPPQAANDRDSHASGPQADIFFAEVAHEIRTPLNGILGMVSLMLDGELGAIQRQRAETMRNSAEALLRILNDVLDTARLDAGRLETVEADFDLAELVEDSVDLMCGRAGDRALDLAAYVEPCLRTMLRGDPYRLRQILLNLIGNAIKFTDAGAVAVEVKTAAVEGDLVEVRFDVIDTGRGVAPEFLPQLFERFCQAGDVVASHIGGSGLGLSICRRLVEMMGGRIGVESAIGLGSDFWFTLPLRRSALDGNEAGAAVAVLQGLRALVVDAVESDRRITARLFAQSGLRVSSAEDGFAATAELERRWFREAPYDLVVVEQSVPGMTSDALIRRIRDDERFADTRIVVMAAPAGAAGTVAGADLVIAKPIRLRLLAESLAQLFGGLPGPVAPPAAPPAEPAPIEVSPTAKRILLAEDNEINQRLALAVLDRAGFTVDVVGDGLEAVAAAEHRRYDLILMDAHMPQLDGTGAAARIRALPAPFGEVPIVALTANAMAGAREKYLALGMNDYLSKPFRLNELLDMVRLWVGPEH